MTLCSRALENRGDTLAAADAHRRERIATSNAVQFVKSLRGDDGARRAYRVTQRNSRTIRVHLIWIQLKLARHRAGLRCKGFIRLDHVELTCPQPGATQCESARRYGTYAHVRGIH